MSKLIIIKCARCNRSIERYRCQIYKNNFCNRHCKAQWQKDHPAQKFTDTQFKRGEFTDDKNYRWTGGKATVPCSGCSRKLQRYASRIKKTKNHFCNPACKGKWQKEHHLRENNPHWKGGIRVSKEGYIRIYKPEHNRAAQNGYVYEHILVAEIKYKRQILKSEHVHHLNGVKDDNRPENLVAVEPRNHDKLSVRHALQERIRELEDKLNGCSSTQRHNP